MIGRNFKIILICLILLSLPISIQAQTVTVPLVFQTGQDPEGDSLFIQIQIATDSLFTDQLILTDWFFCLPNSQYTYNSSFPSDVAHQIYSWRGRHRDNRGSFSKWSAIFRFTLNINQPPSGCACISPSNGEVIWR